MSGGKIISELSDTRISVILPAAGSGSRMGADRPKQWLPLGGGTVLSHTFRFFDALECVKQIVVVLDSDSLSNALCREQLQSAFDTRVDLAPGGDTRQESVYEGLIHVDESADIVAIHDAARPFPPFESVAEAFRQAAGGRG
ncbi:MAG: IspD/TarI family cytidylyltransferase, partial [Candidatus Sumerlaeota bacterium]